MGRTAGDLANCDPMRMRSIAAAALTVLAAGAAAAYGAARPEIFTVAPSLNGPAGLAVTDDGAVYVADTINQRVRRLNSDGSVGTIAGTGKRGFAGDGGPATRGTFQDPTALALARDGSLYIADTANNRVRVFRPDDTIVTVAGTAEQGFSGDGGQAGQAQLDAPSGLAVAANGTLFVADTGNNRVREIAPNGRIATIAGTGAAGSAGDGGPSTAAQLNAPAGLALAADGSLLVADSGNGRVRRIGTDGQISTVASQLQRPLDVAAIPAGGFFVAETGANRVVMVSGGQMSVLAGNGSARYAGDGGAPARASLNAPRAVELMASGIELLIADSDNNRVRYVAIPGGATLLALAVHRATVRAPLRKRVVANVRAAYESTQAARISAVIRAVKGKVVATIHTTAAPGHNALTLPRRLRRGPHRLVKGHYVVRMTATGTRRRATASFELVVE
jgi:sugar lactone lactonase YvrE